MARKPKAKGRRSFVSLEEFGRAFVPASVRPHLSSYILKAGILKVNYKLFGALFWVTLLISAVPYVMYIFPYLAKQSTDFLRTLIFLGLGTFMFIAASMLILSGLVMLIIYFYLDMRIYKRTKEIEDVLPEFLQFVSGNLKGGMSFDRALWGAIKPRFGVLANEIEIVAKKVMTGGDVEEALIEFSNKYDSPMLDKSMGLIVEGMRGGGRIVYLIDKVIENNRETKVLKKEMAASVTSYVIFIAFIIILVAPGLFALSYQLLNIVENLASKLGSTGGTSAPIQFGAVAIDKADFKLFSVLSLQVISIFAAIIMSIIRRGDIKGGLKFIPVFMFFSALNYYAFMFVLTRAFAFIMI